MTRKQQIDLMIEKYSKEEADLYRALPKLSPMARRIAENKLKIIDGFLRMITKEWKEIDEKENSDTNTNIPSA